MQASPSPFCPNVRKRLCAGGDDDWLSGCDEEADDDDDDDIDALTVVVSQEGGEMPGGGEEDEGGTRPGEEEDEPGGTQDSDCEGSEGGEAGPGAGGHAAAWYIDRLDDCLYEGCTLTLAEFLVRLVAIKRRGQVRYRPLQEFLDLIRNALPTPNIVLPTLHLVKKALGVPRIADYEQHACINCCMVWPHIKRAHYAKHMHDKCSVCGEMRFNVRTYSALGRHSVTPRRAWWYFDPKATILDWNKDVEFVQSKRGAVERKEASSFFHEERGEVQRLMARSNGNFLKPGNAYFEIGADGGQMFDKSQHSCVIVVMALCRATP